MRALLCAFCATAGILIATSALAETPSSLAWARQPGTPGSEYAVSVAVDNLGNAYIGGYTDGALNGQTAGEFDAFLTKFDPAGTQLWSKQIGTIYGDDCRSVAVDTLGNVYMGGGTGGALGGPSNSLGAADIYLKKFDGGVNELWSRQIGTNTAEGVQSVAPDAFGNVFLGGSTLGSLAGPHLGSNDAFLMKIDGPGNTLWSRQIATSSNEVINSVVADSLGNAYVTGRTEGNLAGPNAGDPDLFVMKYDGLGNQLWSRQIGSNRSDIGWSTAVDSNGNCYVSGSTSGTLNGPSGDVSGAFLLKYDSSSALQWLKGFGNTSTADPVGLAIDSTGNLYVMGSSFGDFGTPNTGEADADLAKFDASGNLLWAQQFGTAQQDSGLAVAVDPFGSAFITGSTDGDLAGTNQGKSDAYIAKFSPVPEPTGWSIAIGAIIALVTFKMCSSYRRIKPSW